MIEDKKITSDKQPRIDVNLTEISVQSNYLVTFISAIFAFYYLYEGIKPLNILVSISTIIHLFLIFFPYNLDYKSLKPIILTYLLIHSIYLCIIAFFFWPLGQITAFIWFIPILLATMIFFQKKTVFIISIYILVLICSIFIITPFIPQEYIINITPMQLTVVNILSTVLSICLIIFYIYQINKISIIKDLQFSENNTLKNNIDKPEIDKYESLYIDILNYFSKKKPYCDPDFTIIQLAKDLDSNVKYISKVINIKAHVNFTGFMNLYRVNMIKELVATNIHDKYTIRHIYTAAGFKYQSTFNKVFKSIEGITPSEYIKNHKSNEHKE